jgi:hypothetical protein
MLKHISDRLYNSVCGKLSFAPEERVDNIPLDNGENWHALSGKMDGNIARWCCPLPEKTRHHRTQRALAE